LDPSTPQIVLLPGMDGTGKLFAPLIGLFSEGSQVKVIDYPVDKNLDYTQLEAYIRSRLPVREPFILVAESFSGFLAYTIACDPPKNLRSIVFVATFLSPPNRLIHYLIKLPLKWLFRLPVPGVLIRHFLLGTDADDNLIALFQKVLRYLPGDLLASRITLMSQLRIRDVQIINLPCAYIFATEDKLISRNHIDEFRSSIPHIEIIELRAPHFILQSKPLECIEVIKRYLEPTRS